MVDRKLGLDRQTLAKITGNDPKAIRALEQVFSDVDATPSTVEEAAALAGQALSITQTALAMIEYAQELLDQLTSAPVQQAIPGEDDTAPAVQIGTLGAQNADGVEITGGSVDGAPVGANAASTGRFTTVESTVAPGTPPLIVDSATQVPNLNVSALQGATWAAPAAIGGTTSASGKFTTFGTNGKTPQGSAALGAAATDLPTVITLANNIRAALIANGIGS